ncbi:MAG TPA: GlsB/YeaQ/YmgE family stress response membrane protein [Pyrinomonadaceae bacterium]|nr:GlsB/YeaQ/YmgE family stress response membrane protein [Pyrinomonadaceae bacterium]
MISLIIWIILGFLAGYLAKAIMPGPDGGGFILTTILGIVGAVVGGFIGSLFGFPMVSSFDNIGGSIPSFIFSVIGAIAVLAIYRLITGRSVRG